MTIESMEFILAVLLERAEFTPMTDKERAINATAIKEVIHETARLMRA